VTTYRDLKPGDSLYFKWKGPCEYVSARDDGHDYCMAYTFRDSKGNTFVRYERPTDPVYVLRNR
jgi:hypothetical protein